MPGATTLRRILLSALAALTLGLGAASLIAGFSDSFPRPPAPGARGVRGGRGDHRRRGRADDDPARRLARP